jgi:hypothetical protein
MPEVTVGKKTRTSNRIIACSVFRPALEYLQLVNRYPGMRVTYLPSRLHNTPQKLEKRMLREIISARKRGEPIVCLYGECFPDIAHFCQQHGVAKVIGVHCDEMLLGDEQFRQLVDETPGTYFLEQDLILNFEEYCMKPLELHDEEMRRCFFESYQRLLYVRQPSDPDLVPRAAELADFLQLHLTTRDADYSCLEKRLIGLIGPNLRNG